MESSLIDWKDWAEIETGVYCFLDCTVIEGFAHFKVNDPLEYMLLNVTAGLAEVGYLGNDDKHYKTRFKMTFNLEPISTEQQVYIQPSSETANV